MLPSRVRRKATTGSIRIRRDSLTTNGPLVISHTGSSGFPALHRTTTGVSAGGITTATEGDVAVAHCSSSTASPQPKKEEKEETENTKPGQIMVRKTSRILNS